MSVASLPLNGRALLVAWLVGLVELAAGFTLAIWLLSTPLVFRAYYPAMHPSPSPSDAQTIVSWLSSNEDPESLNLQLKSGKLSPKELNHFADVRRLFQYLPRLLLILALVWFILVCIARWSSEGFVAAQWRGLFALGIVFVTCLAFALWDWKVFFAWVHYPFFGATSWKLSRSAYSLKLFPASFWRLAGIISLLVPMAGMLLAAFAIRRGQKLMQAPVTVPKRPIRRAFSDEAKQS